MGLTRRIRNLWLRGRVDAEIEAELRSHLEMAVEDGMRAGMTEEEARRAARLRLGNPVVLRERTMGADSALGLQTTWRDVRFAVRQLRKSPGFTVTAVLTLALGIGATTATFSTMNAVLLRMLPVRNAQDVYTVTLVNGGTQPPDTDGTGHGNTSFSFPVFQALQSQSQIFSSVMAHVPLSQGNLPVRYGNTPTAEPGAEVSGNFFTGLGVPMALGRGFNEADQREQRAKVVVSYGFWTELFSRDPGAIGRTLFIKGTPFTIVGVTAPAFHGADPGNPMDFWIPLQARPDQLGAWGEPGKSGDLSGRPNWWAVPMVVRLAPGVTPKQASAAVQPVFWQAASIGVGKLDPKTWPASLGFQPIRGIEEYVHDYRTPVQAMMALVALVLLIACTNIALLILARNAVRQREFAIRMAAGAQASRIFRQLLTESALLVAAGAALGWGLALVATRALAVWAKIGAGLAPDRRVLLFTLAISVLVTLLFSLAPFWKTMQLNVEEALKSTSQYMSLSPRSIRGGNAAIALQIAMCFTLLVISCLTVRTLLHYEEQNLGMKADNLLIFDLNPQGLSGNVQSWMFYNRLLGRLKAIPGVEAASVVHYRPGSGWLSSGGAKLDGNELHKEIYFNRVGPNYFHTIGVPLLQGREINDADGPGAPLVAVVNETFARRFLPRGALGHKVENNVEIVGVVQDSKYRSVTEKEEPTVYYALAQAGMTGQVTVEVRAATSDPMLLLSTARRTVQEIDPDLPLQNPMTQAAQFEKSYRMPDLFARLAMCFGLLAAVLVATGLYGTLMYRLQRRRSEIGIRIALGALRGTVLWMVARESLLIAAAGFAVGLPLALAAAHLLRSELYHLSELDPISFAIAAGITFLVAAAAALLPARRAAAVDPIQALRAE